MEWQSDWWENEKVPPTASLWCRNCFHILGGDRTELSSSYNALQWVLAGWLTGTHGWQWLTMAYRDSHSQKDLVPYSDAGDIAMWKYGDVDMHFYTAFPSSENYVVFFCDTRIIFQCCNMNTRWTFDHVRNFVIFRHLCCAGLGHQD